jgi:hypothetical protein
MVFHRLATFLETLGEELVFNFASFHVRQQALVTTTLFVTVTFVASTPLTRTGRRLEYFWCSVDMRTY